MKRWCVAVGLCVGVAACGAPPPPLTPAAEPGRPAADATATERQTGELPPLAGMGMEQELEDVTFRQTRGMATAWELHADKVWQMPDTPARLEGVTLRYYGDASEPTIITADGADYSPETQQATLRGHVLITAPNGDSLESEVLDWNADTRVLQTESDVTLRRGGSYITGTGLTTSPGLQDVEMYKVYGVFRDVAAAG